MRWNLSELRRRTGLVAAVAASLVLLLVTSGVAAWRLFGPERFDAVDLGQDPVGSTDLPNDPDAPLALSDSSRVYLVFSTGSKGLSSSEARRLRINDLGSRGADGLTDTIILLVVDPPSRKAAMLSIPRDTWLFDRGHRVNASYNLHGLQGFVDDVAKLAGLPIHHLVEVNFTGFAQLVDDIGGVALAVPRPLADVQSVLYVPSSGCWRFDGAAALSYVRSRHTLTQRNGNWVVHNSASDVGRMGRQQELLAAAWQQIRGPGLITKIPSLLSAARSGLTLDEGLSVRDLADLARTFADIGPSGIEAYTLPTTGRRISGAAAQVLLEDQAKPILKRLRAWPPQPDDQAVPTEDPAGGTTGGTGEQASPKPSPSPSETADTPDEPASPTARPADPAPASPSPSPVPDPEIETLPAPSEDCTKSTARELPSPHSPLDAIYRQRGGDAGLDTEDEASEQPSDEATEDPSGEPTEGEPSPEPSPTDDPTEEPSPEPTLPLPTLPGGGDGGTTDGDGGGEDDATDGGQSTDGGGGETGG